MKKTIVLGASTNPSRYSYKAVNNLLDNNYEVIPMGIKKGEIRGLKIINDLPTFDDIDTITMYINPQRQKEYYDYIIKTNPKRIILNPGTENDELAKLARAKNIEVVENCTLVLLSIGVY